MTDMAYGKGGKGKMGGHSQQMHQGRIRHSDMHSLIDGHGSTDPLAHSSHKEMNSEHGMPAGLSPQGDYDGGGENDPGGSMGDNCEYHE